MSQCCTRKRGSALIVKVFLVGVAMTACSVAELEKFATENAPPDDDIRDYTSVPPGANDRVLVPEGIIKGGRYGMSGITGGIGRLLVGEVDEIRLRRPVAVGGTANYLYIVDADQRSVFKYDLSNKTIHPIGDVGARFAGEPGNIYVVADFSFYIVDSVGQRVFHYSEGGQLLSTFEDPANLSRPLDVYVDEPSGDVYVADGSYSHIVVFNQFGKAIRAIGKRGTGPGRFRAITSIAKSIEGLVVIDRLELPIQVISPLGEFYYSLGEGKHVFPNAVAVANNGWILVSDQSDNTIRVYSNRRLIDTVGGSGHAPARFRLITSMWVQNNLVYIADSLNRRVQIMRIEPNNVNPNVDN